MHSRVLSPELTERSTSSGLDQLQHIPGVTLLGDGAERAAATAAALKAGLFIGIVTCTAVVDYLLR
ncbi:MULTISPECIES: hypothetical protein [Streptomyces]|uniref:hypothetical protein n=1 Tax=Streptomyces TaxID=1883 RepID=UPI00292CB750|nr:hypothetical protein [Streptomyces sp. NEAU-HV9]